MTRAEVLQVAFVGAVLVVAALGLGACSRNRSPGSPSAEHAATAAATSRQAKLDRIFTSDMLGANVAYLETITGPAFKDEGDHSIYLVEGCRVLVGNDGGKIDNLGMEAISSKCHFDLGPFMSRGEGRAVPKGLVTFGDIEGRWKGRYAADCLSGCGDAVAPVVHLRAGGGHADDYNEVAASISLATPPAIDAAEKWKAAFASRRGKGALAYGAPCQDGDTEHAAATSAFGGMHPETIRVGVNIEELLKCDRA